MRASIEAWGCRARFIILPLKPGRSQPWKRSVRSSWPKGVQVSDIVHHDAAQSIYFRDPNNISLEYCCMTRDMGTEDDIRMQERFTLSLGDFQGGVEDRPV